jgi:hypothetical protein
LDNKEDKQKLADISNYNIMNNLLISNQSMNVNIQKDKNDFANKIELENEQDKEKDKLEDKPNNVEVIHMPSKKDSIPNYNSLARNFIFSYEEDDIKEYLQEAKESNTLFSIQNMEENKIENKRMVNSNSYVGDFYNNDDNKSIYFNKLEHENPLNNSHDAISNSTHLFPVFEKNLDFEIESPTNHDKNKNAYDTNDSTSQETKFHNRNMEISKIISNNLHEDSHIPKLNLNYIKQGNEDQDQDNKDEEKLTTRNMVKSYANFYKNNGNYVNSDQENNEEFAKRINFFSNDNNLDISVEETEVKASEVNSPDVNQFVSPPFNFIEEKGNNKLVPLDKFNFFESTDLMRSVNFKSTYDETKTPDKFEHGKEVNKENKQNDNANTKFNQQLSQLSELVLFSPQNRNNLVTPNYVNKFINTTTSKTKTRLTSEIPKFNEEKEPFIPSSTPNILNKNLNNGQINQNFNKNNKSKTNLNKSDLMIENTEKIVFESVKKSGSPQRLSSKINLDIFSDNKPIELEPKMAESNKVLPSATLQPQILTGNRPKIINEEKIDNMVIKLSSKNSLISLHNQNNMNSYCNNGSMLKIHSRKHILNNCKQNSFNVQNESGSGNNVNNSNLNRKESKKYSVGINEKHELKNKEKVVTQNKKSRQMDRPIVPNHKLIQNTNKKNINNNDVFSPSSKGIRPSNIISTNSQVFSPNSNFGNNHIEFKTEKNSISDLLSPTSNVENISYISKFNLDTSKNNNSSISRTINTESSNKMSKKANDSTQNLDPKNPNFSSKKSILEDKVQFESIIYLK